MRDKGERAAMVPPFFMRHRLDGAHTSRHTNTNICYKNKDAVK